MKRSLQCVVGGVALLVSSSAWAQTFGQKGQIAISAERLFGYTHDSYTTTFNSVDTTVKVDSFSLLSGPINSNGVGPGYGTPRVAGDYFIIDNLSVGVALGYSHVSLSFPSGANTATSTSGGSFTFAPRAGYVFTFTDVIGIWPRGGFTYKSLPLGNESAHELALTIEAPLVITLIPHVVFTGGPTLDIGLSGSEDRDMGNGVTTSQDFSLTEFGLQAGMLAYF